MISAEDDWRGLRRRTCRKGNYSYCRCRRGFGSLFVDIDIGFVNDRADAEIAVALHRFARSHAAEIGHFQVGVNAFHEKGGLFRLERSNRAGCKPGTQNVKRVENWKLREPNFGTMAPGAPKSGFG